MLAQPTDQQLQALAVLAQQSWWTKVNELLEAEIQAVVDRMIENRDSAVLHEHRGYIKALKTFQSTAREASTTLEKMGLRAPF